MSIITTTERNVFSPARDPSAPKPKTTEVVYTFSDGREVVRYCADYNSPEALGLINEVLDLQRQHGAACPYSYRHV